MNSIVTLIDPPIVCYDNDVLLLTPSGMWKEHEDRCTLVARAGPRLTASAYSRMVSDRIDNVLQARFDRILFEALSGQKAQP